MTSTIIIGILATGAIFLTKEVLMKRIKERLINNKSNIKIRKLMREKNISFEEAKEKVLTEKLADVFRLEQDVIILDEKIVKQGNHISFNSENYGFVTGSFLGGKKNQLKGSTFIFYVKRPDDTILQAPIECISKGSLMIYERQE